MLQRFGLATVLVLCLSTVAGAQPAAPVVINSDIRLFTMMTALNAAGFDVEVGTQYHPVREAARGLAKRLDPALVARLHESYESHKHNQTDEAQLSKYISLALSLSPPPDFKVEGREELLPPGAREVVDFVGLLKEVFVQAKLESEWVTLAPQYDAEMDRLGPLIREELVRVNGYLRIPSGKSGSKSLDILVELAAPINTAIVQSDQDSYFVVLGQSANPQLSYIRHAYLHFQLDNIVAMNSGKVPTSDSLVQLIKGVDGVQPAYAENFNSMMTESFVRAVELRMDKTVVARARELVDNYYRSGLLLVPYFYDSLVVYEKDQPGLSDMLTSMALDISISTEKARFASSFYAIAPPQLSAAITEVPKVEAPPPPPPPNPTRELLKQAQADLNAKNDERAKAAFEKVLSDYDRNSGAAFYGLALIASRAGEHDEAKDYFERTTRNDAVEPSMKVWAYIYLARIFDLDCERDKAIGYYQQAIKLQDNTLNAQASAQEGVKAPYKGGCE